MPSIVLYAAPSAGGAEGTTVSDTASIDLTLTGTNITGAVLPAGVNHNALANLTVGDAHTQYQLRTEKAAASGYPSLDASTKVPTVQLGGAGADATKFLRGDQTWQVLAGGAEGTTVSDTASVDLTLTGVDITAVVLPAGVDHNSLANLTAGDAHTQYLKLLGRAGGQVAAGGTAASENLDLKSTTHATKGNVRTDAPSGILPWGATASATFTAAPPNNAIGFAGTWTLDFASATFVSTLYNQPVIKLNQSGGGLVTQTFYNNTTIQNVTSVVANLGTSYGFYDNPTLQADTATITGTAYTSFQASPLVTRLVSGGLTLTDLTCFAAGPSNTTGNTITGAYGYKSQLIGGAGATTSAYNFKVLNPGGAGVITTLYGLDIDNLTRGTTNIPIRSSGGNSQHLGSWVVGANAAPTNASCGLEVQSTTLALMLSRMTTTQRNALTAANGQLIYNTTTNAVEARVNGAWIAL